MTRPEIIRADTIDLQDQNAPSAKDHTRQPTNPAPLGDGPPAPHQAIALKNAGFENLELHSRSPRASQDLSGKELQLLQDISDADGHDGLDGDSLGIHGLQRSGEGSGQHGEDGEIGDQDGEDGMDDDMMDKISSSPSIDSGGYQLPWSYKDNSLLSTSPIKISQHWPTDSDISLSSPFLSAPENFPLSFYRQKESSQASEDHHQGEYQIRGSSRMAREDSFSSEARDQLGPLLSESRMGYSKERDDNNTETYDDDFEEDSLHHLLLPADDPLLDNSFDDGNLIGVYSLSGSSSSGSWDYRAHTGIDDDTEDISYADSRLVDSGWGGECLRETEDISFEFVYALHTFVATVEGQANATKGDTMVLLDDSNSYWWLVRVVKDSSIGYLPAEHIETPTERLARLNKHRNIDLSQAMLGDNPEKSKNPLKKAMRRRNAKTVQFSAPTYYEPSDNDYSSDEEGEDGQYSHLTDTSGLMLQDQEAQASQDETATVEPLMIRDLQKDINGNDDIKAEPQVVQGESEQESQLDKTRSSEEVSDYESSSGKSRKGTVRNTDSFFKDDTNETRKITITPALFRDDSNTSTLISGETKEPKTRAGLDTLDKTASPSEKPKDEKRKEKKHGIISSLFKRKDRKSKSQSEDEDPEWLSKEIARQAPGPKVSSDSINQETQPGPVSPGSRSPQRQTSKLQKAPPIKVASPTKRAPSREGQMSPIREMSASQPGQIPSVVVQPPRTSLQADSVMESERHHVEQPSAPVEGPAQSVAPQPLQPIEELPPSPIDSQSRGGIFAPIRDALRSSPSTSETKVEHIRLAKERMPIEDSESSPDVEQAPSNSLRQPEKVQSNSEPMKDRLSESPVQVSPIQPANHLAQTGETSSQEEPSMSMSTSSTPELVEVPQEESVRDDATPTSTIQSSRIPSTWSDASLRTYLEDDTDIRDLLVVVHDKTDIKPAGPDHPVVQNLCREENRRLGEMSSRLDAMLQGLLARKSDNAAR